MSLLCRFNSLNLRMHSCTQKISSQPISQRNTIFPWPDHIFDNINDYNNKREHSRVISELSLNDIHYQSLSHSMTMLTILTNRFLFLVIILSEYASLIEIDLEISLSNDTYFMTIALLDCETQDSLINELYIKSNVISFKWKSQLMILYLVDEKKIHKKDFTQFASVILEIDDHKKLIILDISNITHDIILDLS